MSLYSTAAFYELVTAGEGAALQQNLNSFAYLSAAVLRAADDNHYRAA
jgi:hypothetical protein